jgi:hypothetical protein
MPMYKTDYEKTGAYVNIKYNQPPARLYEHVEYLSLAS